jgi:hypothetical protein
MLRDVIEPVGADVGSTTVDVLEGLFSFVDTALRERPDAFSAGQTIHALSAVHIVQAGTSRSDPLLYEGEEPGVFVGQFGGFLCLLNLSR